MATITPNSLWKFFGGISLKPTTAPGSPEAGDIYFDSTTQKLYVYQNGAFTTFSTSAAFVGTNPEIGGSTPFVLTAAHSRTQVFNVGGVLKLPTTSIKAGEIFLLVNRSSSEMDIQSSGSNSIDKIFEGHLRVVALQDTPTNSTHWKVIEVYEEFDLSQSFSFPTAGTTSFTLKVYRHNRLVTIHLPSSITRTSMSTGTVTTTLSVSRLFPDLTHQVWAYTVDNGTDAAGTVRVSTAGVITIFKTITSNFTGGAGATGLSVGQALSYRVS